MRTTPAGRCWIGESQRGATCIVACLFASQRTQGTRLDTGRHRPPACLRLHAPAGSKFMRWSRFLGGVVGSGRVGGRRCLTLVAVPTRAGRKGPRMAHVGGLRKEAFAQTSHPQFGLASSLFTFCAKRDATPPAHVAPPSRPRNERTRMDRRRDDSPLGRHSDLLRDCPGRLLPGCGTGVPPRVALLAGARGEEERGKLQRLRESETWDGGYGRTVVTVAQLEHLRQSGHGGHGGTNRAHFRHLSQTACSALPSIHRWPRR